VKPTAEEGKVLAAFERARARIEAPMNDEDNSVSPEDQMLSFAGMDVPGRYVLEMLDRRAEQVMELLEEHPEPIGVIAGTMVELLLCGWELAQ
jgi:hypothetical protein